MPWRQKPLGYDPKDFPNYNLYQCQETGFQRLLEQWPIIFTFVAWTFTFLISILTIIKQWFWMVISDPLHYNKANAWIIEQYQLCPTVFQMTYGAFITVWFFHLCYRGGLVVCDMLLDAYNDPMYAIHQVLGFSYYVESLFFRGTTLILCAIFKFACSFVVLLYNMSIHALSGVIFVLGAVALFQLHYCFFIRNHEATKKEPPVQLKGILKRSPEIITQSPKTSPGRCYRAPTPSTGSTLCSSNTSPDPTPCRRRPSPKSNKPPRASYVKISPKSIEKLRADGYGVPEPTRETNYSWVQTIDGDRLSNLRRSPIRVQPSPLKFKEVEEKKAEAEDETKFVRAIVPTKAQWVYSSLDAVERRVKIITEEVTDLRTQVSLFKEAGIVRPIPKPSDDLPASPRTQQREVTLAERERIKATMAHHIPRIENAAMSILKQQHGVEELLTRIDNLITRAAKSGCAVSRAMSGETEDYRIKIKNVFGDARQTLINSRNVEELCEDRLVKLAEEANRLKRLDRAHLLLLEINARQREMEMLTTENQG
ncbi:hypothetical protein FLONG3_2207 [Fusarium longipes]|uniref:Uncharacterized protein n=1 Tax=Fusarium longipes TaxID=694270 RepID=A0A395T4J2_9HYPO|nr:hypothetical protein FLONG3_2207 [Fusarium longipes]